MVMLGLNTMRGWVQGMDDSVVNRLAENQRYHAQAEAARAAEWRKQEYARNMARDAASLSGEVASSLHPRAGDSESTAAARQAMARILFGGQGLPSDPKSGDLLPDALAQRLEARGLVGQGPEGAAGQQNYRVFQEALVNAAAAQANPGGFHRGLAGLNESLQNSRLGRAGMYTGIGAGGVAGGVALTEGAQQLIALMGFLQEGEEMEAKAERSPLAR